jgi:exopolyphosphatase/guanosine-5'-triphosphate,3'-diphosphate pyrophosphatase
VTVPSMKTLKRAGVIELGSRALRLLIVDHAPGQGLQVVQTDSAESRLAIALDSAQDRRPEILARAGEIARQYEHRCRAAGAEAVCVFGTEALRQLTGAEVERLRAALPTLIILDAAQEARCSLLAAALGVDGAKVDGEVLAIDQGAASMELAAGHFTAGKLKLISTFSTPLGTRPLTQQLAAHGGWPAFRAALQGEVDALNLPPGSGAARVILLGSAATKLAWLHVRSSDAERYTPRLVQGRRLAVQDIDQLLGIAEAEPQFARKAIDVRSPESGEFEIVIAGLTALRLVLQRLGCASFTVSAFGTRHGMAWLLFSGDAPAAAAAQA